MRSYFTTIITACLTTGCAMLLAQSVHTAGFYISEVSTPGSNLDSTVRYLGVELDDALDADG